MTNLRSSIDLTNDDNRIGALVELDRCESDDARANWTRKWGEGVRDLLKNPAAACEDILDDGKRELETELTDLERTNDNIKDAAEELIEALDEVEAPLPATAKAKVEALEKLLCA